MKERIDDYLRHENPVLSWLDESIVKVSPLNGKCTFVPTIDLWADFNTWWIKIGGDERAFNKNTFSSKLAGCISQGQERKAKHRTEGTAGPRVWGYYDVELKGKTFAVHYDSENGFATLKMPNFKDGKVNDRARKEKANTHPPRQSADEKGTTHPSGLNF